MATNPLQTNSTAGAAKNRQSHQGLTSVEASSRLQKYGANEISVGQSRSAITTFFLHFTNPLSVILLLASAVSAFVGEVTNASIIVVIVLLSVSLDYFQERRSGKAAELLRQQIALKANVYRDGKLVSLPTRELVAGDVVSLMAGDIVPADAVLIEAKHFFVDQAALTGESFPVEKFADSGVEKEREIFLGTGVTSGEALAEIIRTGGATEFGHITKTLTAKPVETEFERGTQSFGIFIMKVVVGLVLFVFLVNIAFKRDAFESFLFAIALAVGLTPGLLPMIVSVTLAHGALRLARKSVIVKRLAAIENLGSIDILCTDKTGTLTAGAITLERHVNLKNVEDEQVIFYALLNSTFQSSLRSPLDEAILRHQHEALPAYKKVDELPFDFLRRCLSVVVEGNGRKLLITKGAPESIQKICSRYQELGEILPLNEASLAQCNSTFAKLSEDGYRVLGVAYRDLTPDDSARLSAADEADLIFIGFAAFLDPPKQSVSATLKALKRDGVEVKVLTGDNELVTRKICAEVGLEIKGLVTGDELALISDDALMPVAIRATVFARVLPDQKRRIILALKRAGHVVGYLGDGINDAPSLRAADVSLSVDTAVDVARESADMILLKKSLRVVHDGILEGRRTFGNIMKYILMGTSSNFGNMFSMAGASLFLPFLPMLPPQILLNNLLYDASQVTIPGDRVDPEYLKKPKSWNIALIRRYMIWMGLISSLFDFLTFAMLLWIFAANAELFRTGWFIESLATQTLVILVIRTHSKPWQSRPSRALVVSTSACVLVGAILPFTPLAKLLGFTPLSATMMAAIAFMVLIYLLLAETLKRALYKRHFA